MRYGRPLAGVLAAVLATLTGCPRPRPPTSRPPPPRQATETSLLFTGDVLPLEDRDYLTDVASLVERADFAVCNLECPLSLRGAKAPVKFDGAGEVRYFEFFFRAPPSQAQRLVDAGFDVVTLANNHIMDYGGDALTDTLRELERVGLGVAGAGLSIEAARRPLVRDVNGQSVALLAYVSDRTLPGTDGFAATTGAAGTVFVSGDKRNEPTQASRDMLREDIGRARAVADFVVVCFHWGTERVDWPDALPHALACWSIECGAGLVIGHHPHVLQAIELYEGRPIIYSLGNFAFKTPWECNRYGAALEVRLHDGEWSELVLWPVKLAEATGDPSPATGKDLRHLRDRAVELSAAIGTVCECAEDGAQSRIVVRNPHDTQRAEALPSEAIDAAFHAEPHPSLRGMAVVSFLAWDLHAGQKVAKSRRVVVNDAVAPEVLAIVKRIYVDPERFPIHDVVGYTKRTVTGGTRLSNHALGRAIDINRAENPMVQDGSRTVHPDEPPYTPGEWRPGIDPYSMGPQCSVVRAFRSHGWRWGGDWTTLKDYQHFDKPR